MDGEAHGQTRTGIADLAAGSGWVNTDVAARAVRVSPRTIRRLIERGKLAAKQEGEGVEKRWLVSVDSLHLLRASRSEGADGLRGDRGVGRENIRAPLADTPVDGMADVVRNLAVRLEERTAEAVEYRTRLEITERAQSTVEEEARRLREENERLRSELEGLKKHEERPWWRRVFGF
jgi:hypothetical protein